MGTEFFWFYDVILAAVLIGTVLLGFKKGFVRMLLSLVSIVIAFAAALIISGGVAGWVYDGFVQKPLEETISNTINETFGNNVIKQLSDVDMSVVRINGKKPAQLSLKPDDAGKITLNLNKLDLSKTGIGKIDLSVFGYDSKTDFSSLNLGTVQFYETDLKEHGIEKMLLSKVLAADIKNTDAVKAVSAVTDKVNETLPMLGISSDLVDQIDSTIVSDVILSVLESAENPGKSVLDNIVKPLVLIPIQTLIFTILFAVILFVLSLIIRATSIINKVPVLGKLNEVLGGVMGILQGVVVIFVIVIGVHLAVSISNNSLIFLNEMTINKSFAFSTVYNFPFLDFLK